MFNFDIVTILKTLPAVLIGLIIHELAHVYTAYKLGDSTAKDDGRLTLNPLKHFDPIGFILIVVAGFGWAKPVNFNPDNLKHKHRDEIFIALAGPISNFLLAVFFLVLARVLFNFDFLRLSPNGIVFFKLLILWSQINIGLFLFNLIPIPPLDGSHIYTTFLAKTNPGLINLLFNNGTWGVVIIIVVLNFFKLNPLGFAINGIVEYILRLLS